MKITIEIDGTATRNAVARTARFFSTMPAQVKARSITRTDVRQLRNAVVDELVSRGRAVKETVREHREVRRILRDMADSKF